MTLLTVDQLRAMIPTNKEVEEWCEELNKALPKYGITTPERIAGFVSQCAHESADFVQLLENLNYSQQSLERHAQSGGARTERHERNRAVRPDLREVPRNPHVPQGSKGTLYNVSVPSEAHRIPKATDFGGQA